MAKLVSILGDSISTFEGHNPAWCRVYYQGDRRTDNGLADVGDTWWMQVIEAFAARLCANGSYSGSWVSGALFPVGTDDKRIAGMRGAEGDPDTRRRRGMPRLRAPGS